MATPTTRSQFADYCLRRLGWDVIEINVSDEQISDRIDDALLFYYDYHFDGSEKIYMKHQITQEDIDRKWVYVPEAVTFINGIFPFDESTSSINMFDLRYQLRLHDLYDFTSVSYVPYEITMQHLRTLNLLFSGTPQIRHHRHTEKLYLDIDWTRDIRPGEYVVIDCYRALRPDLYTIPGTVQVSNTDVVVTGTNTNFSRGIISGDEIVVNGEGRRVVNISSPTELKVNVPFTNSGSGLIATMTGNSKVWNDRFLKQYATALIKKQWGENLKKFGGISMPGGVTLNGKEIWDEATEEIRKLEEEMHSLNVLPGDFIMG